MKRNWNIIDSYYHELINQDIYPQPKDDQHVEWASQVIDRWMPQLISEGCLCVLDVGCGVAFTQDMFESRGVSYIGITLGSDYNEDVLVNKNVYQEDFNFIPELLSGVADVVFSRHSLEHSPFPLLTLMEWHRVSKEWLILVMPNPRDWTYLGRNHYSVMPPQLIRWMLRRAGWKILDYEYTRKELRYLCQKLPRISYEGYAETPLDNSIYEQDRDAK